MVQGWFAAPVLLALGLGQAGAAQDFGFPSDKQVQATFAVLYDHVGLIEYCADKGFATAEDVAAVHVELKTMTTSLGTRPDPAAMAHEAQGRSGVILGRQFIGLMRQDSATHPEIVADGQTMTLADNARAQGLTVRVLCGRMAAQEQAQVAPLRALFRKSGKAGR